MREASSASTGNLRRAGVRESGAVPTMDNKGVAKMKSSSASSWVAIEGSLEDSVKMVEKSEDSIHTAGTSKLVLMPTRLGSSPVGDPARPCELIVTFQERPAHVDQIYVLSTARICEIYGQREQDGDLEYFCTVRGGIVSLTDEYLPGPTDSSLESDFTNAEDFSNTSPIPSIVADVKETGMQELVSPSGENDPSHSNGASLSFTAQECKEDLFQSLTNPTPKKNDDGTVLFEESLDQVDWVECPNSPMKSILTSDDDAELDNCKCGFYFIDAYGETQYAEHEQVELFSDGIYSHLKSGCASFHCNNKESTDNCSWQAANGESTSATEESMDSTVAQGCSALNETLIGPAVDIFEITGENDASNSVSSNHLQGMYQNDEELEIGMLKSCAQRDAGTCNVLASDVPVYECEVNLVNADAWTSITIRLLSMKNKAQVDIHRAVVTYVSGPLQCCPKSSGEPSQQGGVSSTLTSLVPGILQMVQARGLLESRKENNLAISRLEKRKAASESISSEINIKDMEFQNLETAGQVSKDHTREVYKNLTVDAKNDDSVLNHLVNGYFGGLPFVGSSVHGEALGLVENEQLACGERLSSRVLPDVVESSTSRLVEITDEKEIGSHDEAHLKEDCKVGGLVQRLDHLELICLRIERSLNSALENMDKRLKVLESCSSGQMPALGQSICGPGCDSSSSISATSVHQAEAQKVAETGSLMDSQIAFSDSPLVNSFLGEASASTTSSVLPFCDGLHSPSSPSPTSSVPPFCDGLHSSSSPFVSSIPSNLPSWPSCRPDLTSPHWSSQSSSLSSSVISQNSQMSHLGMSMPNSNCLNNDGEEKCRERSSSDDTESDLSSDSEQTSCAGYCESSRCQWSSEPHSPSPVKPAQLVDNALASALAAFSASFGARNIDLSMEHRVCDEEVRDKEDSFTSEEQVPLVDFKRCSCDGEKEEIAESNVEEVFLHDHVYPLFSDKVIGDWRQIIHKSDGNKQSSKVIVQDSDKSVYHFTTIPDASHGEEEIVPQKNSELDVGIENFPQASFDACAQDLEQYPLLQDFGLETDARIVNRNHAKPALHVSELVPTVGSFSKPCISRNGALLKEDLFRKECNWFALQVSPFSSLVEIGKRQVETPSERPLNASLEMRETFKLCLSFEATGTKPGPWSFLDPDASTALAFHGFDKNFFGVDLVGQNDQWPSLGEHPPRPICLVTHPEDSLEERLEKNEPLSLLDENISTPSAKISTMEHDWNHNSAPVSFDEFVSDVSLCRPDAWESPSSQTLRSNFFKDKYDGKLDSRKGSNNLSLCKDILGLFERIEPKRPPLEERLEKKEPLPLLDEDISIPSGKIATREHDWNLNLAPVSADEFLSDVSRSYALESPSLPTSRSNTFKDEYDGRLDLRQGSNNLSLWKDILDLFERSEPKRPALEERLEQKEPLSLLDEDISILSCKISTMEHDWNFNSAPVSANEFLSDVSISDALESPSSQTSRSNPLINKYDGKLDLRQESKNLSLCNEILDFSRRNEPKGPQFEERLEQKEPLSLLNEDISIPSGKISTMEHDWNVDLAPASTDKDIFRPSSKISTMEQDWNLNLAPVPAEEFSSDVSLCRSDALESPSSQTSRSNPLKDKYDGRLDLRQGSNNLSHLCKEILDLFKGTAPERPQC